MENRTKMPERQELLQTLRKPSEFKWNPSFVKPKRKRAPFTAFVFIDIVFKTERRWRRQLDARDGVWLLKLGLGEGAGGQDLILRLDDGHVVGERPLGSNLALRVPRQHNLDPIRERT